MTISSETNRSGPYNGNGVTVVFTGGFKISDEEHVQVILADADGIETTQTLTIDYSVTGVGADSFSVTMVTAPASGETLTLIRSVPFVQEMDLENQGPFFAETIEAAFDLAAARDQQLQEQINRAVKATVSSDIDPDAVIADLFQAAADAATAAAAAEAAVLGDVAAATHIATSKATPIDADELPIVDTAASNILKKLTWANLKATAFAAWGALVAAGTSKATPVDADNILIADSAASNATKRLTWANVKATLKTYFLGSGNVALPLGHIYGCTLSNNGSDATNDIDFAAGTARDSTDAVNITCAAMTKRLDANWAAGTNQGMRNSGAAITDTTYHLYAVAKADGTQDYYAHTSTTVATVLTALQAETGGASYIYARRIGSIIRSSGAIVVFRQTGDLFERAPVTDRASSSGAASALLALSIPAGLALFPILRMQLTPDTNSNITNWLGSAAVGSANIAVQNVISGASGAAAAGVPTPVFKSNTSRQIYFACTAAAGSVISNALETIGWIDNRDRLA